MKLNREHFHAIIFYILPRGLTQQQFIDELNSIFSDEAPSRTSVYWWCGEFNRGLGSLQDEFREGRPKSVVVPETIDAVRQLILKIRHVTYCEIETTLGISGTSIYSILHEHLTVKKKKQFVNRSKKGLRRLVEINAPKIRSLCFETRLWHRDRWWIVDLRVWAWK